MKVVTMLTRKRADNERVIKQLSVALGELELKITEIKGQLSVFVEENQEIADVLMKLDVPQATLLGEIN